MRLPIRRRANNPTRLYQPVGIYSPTRVIARGGSPVIGSGSAPSSGGAMSGGGSVRRRHGGGGWCGLGWGACWGPWIQPWWLLDGAPPPLLPISCRPPIVDGRLRIDEGWAIECFAPIYENVRGRIGPNATAIGSEILTVIMPDAALGPPSTGAEHELRRRIELAVAVLLGAEGLPTRFPPNPPTPKPAAANAISTPWIRAIATGWI